MTIRKPYLVLLLIFIVLGVYYPSLFSGFNSVDDVRMINGLENLETVKFCDVFIKKGGGNYYRPLLELTFIFDKYVWGMQPGFMHMENIMLHAINAVVVFLIAGRIFALFGYANPGFAFFASLLFALHPINTESVNWVSARTDVLAGSFLLFSLYLFLRHLKNWKKATVLLSFFFFFIACLCKETAFFAFPGFLFLMYVTRKKIASEAVLGYRPLGRINMLCSTLGYSSIAAGYFLLRYVALSGGDRGVKQTFAGVLGEEISLQQKLWLMIKAFGFYIKKLVIPWPLNFTITHVSDAYFIVGLLGIFVTIYLLWQRKISGAMLFFSACIIAPALLVPAGGVTWTPLAERYVYMAVPTFCIAGIYGVVTMPKPDLPKLLLGLSVSLIFSGIAWSDFKRNIVWQNNLTLFKDSVRKNSDFMPARNELALAMRKAGLHKEANKLFMSNSLSSDKKNSIVTNLNKASAMVAVGKIREARLMLKEASYTCANPLFSRYLQSLIEVNDKLLQQKNIDQSEKILLKEENISFLIKLQSHTGDPVYYYSLGQRFLREKSKEKAQYYFSMAYKNSSPTAYYHEASKKLSEKLK